MVINYLNFILSIIYYYPLISFFLAILTINVLLIRYLQFKNSNNILNSNNIKDIVNLLYIKNHYYYGFIILIIYFFINVGILFIIRLFSIGSYNNIYKHTLKIPFGVLVIIVSVVILVGLIKRLLYESVSLELFKFYLYLYSKDNIKRCMYKMFQYYNETWSNEFINNIYIVLSHLSPTNTLVNFSIQDYKEGEFLISYETLISIRKLLKRYKSLANLQTKIFHNVNFIKENWSSMKAYLPQFMLFLVLWYDLSKGMLHYIYYATPLFVIVTIIKSIYEYIGTKDQYILDPILVNYLYKESSPLSIIHYQETLKKYLSNGYYGEIMTEFFTVELTKVHWVKNVRTRNIYIILAISILSWNLLFFTSINNTLIMTIPLLVMYISLETDLQIIEYSKKKLKKLIFFLSTLTMIIINIWVYLTRYNIYYIRETIWSWGITINQTFTLKEKTNFLYNYLNIYLNNNLDVSNEAVGIILSKLYDEHFKEFLNENTTLEQIRNYVEYLPLYYYKLEHFYISKLEFLNNDIISNILEQQILLDISWDNIAYQVAICCIFIELKIMYPDSYILNLIYDLMIMTTRI